VAIDVASLAPHARITVYPWKDPPELKAGPIKQVRLFLPGWPLIFGTLMLTQSPTSVPARSASPIAARFFCNNVNRFTLISARTVTL